MEEPERKYSSEGEDLHVSEPSFGRLWEALGHFPFLWC